MHLVPQRTYDRVEIAGKLARAFEGEGVADVVAGKTVLLKVSFVFPAREPERTIITNTNPALIIGAASAFIELGARKVLVGDGETFGPARYAFALSGVVEERRALPKWVKRRVELCFFDECAKDWLAPESPFVEGEDYRIDFPRVARDVDVFVSMPKLKVNIFTGVTLSVKNGMGMVSKGTRLRHHGPELHDFISDIFQLRPPDYVITDAIVAGEGQGPMNASPYPTNLIVFGNDALAVDSTCCQLMGLDPRGVPHLVALEGRGLGSLDLAGVRLEGAGLLKERRHAFERPKKNLGEVHPDVRVYRGTTCESGCEAFLQAIFDSYGLERGWDRLGEVHIIVGKDPEIPASALSVMKEKKRRVVVYGDCARPFRKYGKFYGGCSPDYMRAMITMFFRNSFGLSPFGKKVKFWTLAKSYVRHFLATIFGKKYSRAPF
ncbi:MAG: DUF362 domain-containing protein [Promethearchaeota archaeon]